MIQEKINLTIKKQLFAQCRSYVDLRVQRILTSIADLEESLLNESKSSAGDKYETGREMINIEYEKLSGQLQEFRKLEATLTMAERKTPSDCAELGSIVRTTGANYFIAIPSGELWAGDEKFYAIGTNAPIAQALIGKKEGDEMVFNGNSSKIISIL